MTIVRSYIVPQIEPRGVAAGIPLIVTPFLPNAQTGIAYSFQMMAVGGTPPYTWSITSATPDTGNWLSIDPPSGTLSGTPGTVETETVWIKVTDSLATPTAPTAFSLTVVQGNPAGAPQSMWPGYQDTTSVAFMWVPTAQQLYWVDAGFTASAASGVLTVTAMNKVGNDRVTGNPVFGTIAPGQTLSGATPTGVPTNVTIASQLSGTTGGVGTYSLSGPAFTAASQNMSSNFIAYYNIYRNNQKIIVASPPSLYPGSTPNPTATNNQGGLTIPRPYPWFVDTGLTPGTNNTYTVTGVSNVGESQPGPPLVLGTLATGPSTLPTPVVDPATWIQDGTGALNLTTFKLPTGGTTRICNTTADFTAALAASNINGGDIIVLTAGNSFPSPSGNGFTIPAFTGANGWTYIISSQEPVYQNGGTLVPYSFTAANAGFTSFTLTAAPAAAATSATLTAPWALKTGQYYALFTEGGVQEERLVEFVNGSASITWGTSAITGAALNSLYATNGITGLSITAAGTGYTNGSYNSVTLTGQAQMALSGGTGTGAMLDSAVVASNALSSFSLGNVPTGNGYAVNDVVTMPGLPGGTGATLKVTSVGGNGAGLTSAATSATIQVNYLPGVTPTDAGSMPTLTWGVPAGNQALINPLPGCTKVRFVGINMLPTQGGTHSNLNIALFQSISFTNNPALCEQFYFDRCLMGNDTNAPGWMQIQHGVNSLTCNHFLMHQCYMWGVSADFNVNTGDSNNLGVGGGNHCWQNSYLQCAGETIIYGGAPVAPAPDTPHDLVCRYSVSHKPASWYQGYPNRLFPYTTGWGKFGQVIKDHLEFKCAHRAEYYGNLVLNAWMGTVQSYHSGCFMVNPRDQNWAAFQCLGLSQANPWSNCLDINIHDNQCYNVGSLLQLFTGDPSIGAYADRVWVHNNLAMMSPLTAGMAIGEETRGLNIQGPASNLTLDHNTIINNTSARNIGATTRTFAWISGNAFTNSAPFIPNGYHGYLDKATITNNIFDQAIGSGTLSAFLGSATLDTFPNFICNKNLTISDTAVYGSTPGTTFFPGTFSNVAYGNIGFVNFRANNLIPFQPSDFNVTGATVYATGSTTGGPVGCTFPSLNSTWWAPNSPWNAQIPAGAFSSPMGNSAAVISAYQSAGGSITNAFNPQSSTFTAALIVAPAGQATTTWTFSYNVSGTWTFTAIPATGAIATQIQNAASFFQTNGDSDRSINLYSTDQNVMYDIYPDAATSGGNGPIAIVTASVRPLEGSGWWNQANFTTLSSGTASGADQVGGSIKPSEWAAGVIPHALMGAYPVTLAGGNTSSPDSGEAFIYPARGSDGNFGSFTNQLPHGARLQLDPSLSDATLLGLGVTSAMLPVCHALQKYGWYSMDIDGTFPAQIKFLSTNPNGSSGFNGPYPGATSLPMALMAHMAWIHGPYLVGSSLGTSGAGMGVNVTGTGGQCSYTTNFGSSDGLVHVGDIMTVYPAWTFSSTTGTGGLQGFAPSPNVGVTSWWAGVSYKVSAVSAGAFTLQTLAGAAITSTVGTMNVYFTTNTAIDSPASALASGLIRQGP